MCCPTTIINTPTAITGTKRTRRVSFTADNDIFEVERVDAALIQDLFYGAADYRRFREERRNSILATPSASTALVVNKPKKHGDDAGYMQRRQRLQRLVANRDDKITVASKAPRPSSSLRRAPRRGPSQQIALQNMRSRVAAASA